MVPGKCKEIDATYNYCRKHYDIFQKSYIYSHHYNNNFLYKETEYNTDLRNGSIFIILTVIIIKILTLKA